MAPVPHVEAMLMGTGESVGDIVAWKELVKRRQPKGNAQESAGFAFCFSAMFTHGFIAGLGMDPLKEKDEGEDGQKANESILHGAAG